MADWQFWVSACVCHLTEMIVTYCKGLLTLINLIED